MRTQEMNRLQIMGKALESSCKRILDFLDKEVARLEKALDECIESEEEWSDKKVLLKTAPGIGDTMVYTLLADMPELGHLEQQAGRGTGGSRASES